MRSLALALALALPFAGCLQDAPPAAEATVPPVEAPEDGPTVEEAAAPDLPVGRAWTYAAALRYNPETEIKVVVAANGSEVLFAGGEEADVVTALVWGEPWYGPRDAELSQERYRLYDFPLLDAKSWDVFDGLTVTARAVAEGGRTRYVMTGETETGFALAYDYDPDVGSFTSYVSSRGGEPIDQLTLVRTEEGASWVWAEGGGASYHFAESPEGLPDGVPRPPAAASAAPYEVGADAEALLASVGARGAARLAITAPSGEAQVFENAEGEAWSNALLEAEQGAWTLSVARSDGWAGFAVRAVTWVRG